MSLTNPIDYTGFSSPFKADVVANHRNIAEAKKKAGNYLRAGMIGGFGASELGKGIGSNFLTEARAYAAAQQRTADMFGKAADAVGSIGGFAAAGGFNKPPTEPPTEFTYDSNIKFDTGVDPEKFGKLGNYEYFKPSNNISFWP